LSGVVRLNRAPVSNEILKVKLPRPAEARLNNGISLMVLEDHRTPSFALTLLIRASSLQEPPELAGAVADATAYLLSQGTKTRDARQIAETLAELGGSLSASAGSRNVSVSVSGLTDNLDELLGLFADILLNPSFPQSELDLLVRRQLSSLQAARSQPGFLANERLYAMLYPNDARKITAPTAEALKRLTRQDIVKYYDTYYKPGGALIGVAGDVTLREMAPRLEKLLGGWKGSPPPLPKLPLEPPIREKRIALIDRPNSVQTYLMVANRAIGRKDPDYIPCILLNQVLGSGPASRLFRNIREEKGYTYGISSGFSASWYFNDFTAATSVRTEVTEAALNEILKEFRDIRERLVPADELDGARRAQVGSFARSLESTSNLLSRAIELKEFGLPADYWDKFPERIMKLRPEQIREVARKYVPVDNVQIVAVGDASRIRDVLKKFGPVEEYTAEGKPVSGSR
jgi:predicted Zn-dependent peptidase